MNYFTLYFLIYDMVLKIYEVLIRYENDGTGPVLKP